jgi:hypothetical protein
MDLPDKVFRITPEGTLEVLCPDNSSFLRLSEDLPEFVRVDQDRPQRTMLLCRPELKPSMGFWLIEQDGVAVVAVGAEGGRYKLGAWSDHGFWTASVTEAELIYLTWWRGQGVGRLAGRHDALVHLQQFVE